MGWTAAVAQGVRLCDTKSFISLFSYYNMAYCNIETKIAVINMASYWRGSQLGLDITNAQLYS